MSRTNTSSIASHSEAITKVDLGKFTLVTSVPASTSDLVADKSEVENNSQMLMFSNAYDKYGKGVAATLMIR